MNSTARAFNVSTLNATKYTAPVFSTTNISGFAIGSSALLINAAILLTLLTNRKFLRKSAFIFALALANFIVGFAYAYSSAYRMILSALRHPSGRASATECLSTMMPELYFMAFSSLAAVLLVSGVERLVAVLAPTWYFVKWKPSKNWYVVGFIYSWVLLWVIAASANAALNVLPPSVTGIFLTTDCLWIAVAGDGFTVFFFFCSIVGGLGAVVTSLASLAIGLNRYARLPQLYCSIEVRKRARRQLQLTKAMLSVAIIDFGLTVIPNILLVIPFIFKGSSGSLIIYSLYMYNANAVLNMLAHVVFNSDFRKAAFKFIRLDKVKACKTWVKRVCTVKSSVRVGP